MAKKLGHKDIQIKQLKKRIKRLEGQMGTKAEAEYEDKIQRNSWHNAGVEELFSLVKEVVQKSKNHDWLWICNSECKYVEIRVDMRNGGAVLCNRRGLRISPDQLKYQYKGEE